MTFSLKMLLGFGHLTVGDEEPFVRARHVVVYLDVILVTATNNRTRLSNLRTDFIRSPKANLKLKRDQ